jgi:cytochrome P450
VSDLQVFERHGQVLIDTIVEGDSARSSHHAGKGIHSPGPKQTVHINDLLLRFTLDTATEFLLGTSVDSMRTPRQDFAEVFAEVQRIQNFITRSGPANVLIPKASYNAGIRTIEKFISPFIEEALSFSPDELAKNMEAKYTFLQALASVSKDRNILRDQIVAIPLAGRDTTAAALSWTIHELAQHPEMVRKLRAEIIETIGLDAAPTYRNLKDMKFLQCVINETLRLYPSVPFNLRIALSDTSLPRGGGPSGEERVGVLKDTIVGYSVLAMQRREDLYPADARPFKFDPDRWLKWQPKPWTYILFNGGPRICIGQQFALTEAGYTLVRLFQRFESLQGFDDPSRACLKSEVVLQPAFGVIVAFTQVSKDSNE